MDHTAPVLLWLAFLIHYHVGAIELDWSPSYSFGAVLYNSPRFEEISLFIHATIEEHSGCSWVWANKHGVSVNVLACLLAHLTGTPSSVGYAPMGGIAECKKRPTRQMTLHAASVTYIEFPLLHVLSYVFVISFIFVIWGCAMVRPCGFNVHFSGY